MQAAENAGNVPDVAQQAVQFREPARLREQLADRGLPAANDHQVERRSGQPALEQAGSRRGDGTVDGAAEGTVRSAPG